VIVRVAANDGDWLESADWKPTTFCPIGAPPLIPIRIPV